MKPRRQHQELKKSFYLCTHCWPPMFIDSSCTCKVRVPSALEGQRFCCNAQTFSIFFFFGWPDRHSGTIPLASWERSVLLLRGLYLSPIRPGTRSCHDCNNSRQQSIDRTEHSSNTDGGVLVWQKWQWCLFLQCLYTLLKCCINFTLHTLRWSASRGSAACIGRVKWSIFFESWRKLRSDESSYW